MLAVGTCYGLPDQALSKMLIKRLAYVIAVAVAKAMCLLDTLSDTQREAFFDRFSRKSIIHWVASTFHRQSQIRSKAEGVLKHEMRKLQGLELRHAMMSRELL